MEDWSRYLLYAAPVAGVLVFRRTLNKSRRALRNAVGAAFLALISWAFAYWLMHSYYHAVRPLDPSHLRLP